MVLGRDLTAPSFAVVVEGTDVTAAISSDVVSVEYEHTIDVINELSIVVANVNHRYTDSRLWSPGNEVELYMGYGSSGIDFVGRAEIVRHLPSFPDDGIPTLRIKAYDRGYRMTKQELKIAGGASKRPKKEAKESGQVFDSTLGNVLTFLLGKYGIEAKVDPSLANKKALFTQRKGTNDYKIVRALANLNGADFWVEYEPSPIIGRPGEWVGRFIETGTAEQAERYTFRWGTGQGANLISVDLDFGMPGQPTEIQLWVWDRHAKDWVLIGEEETKVGEIEDFSGILEAPGEEAGPIESMTRVKLAASGHSIEVITRPFDNPETAAAFVAAWFKRYKDVFVQAQAKVPGIASLRAGQTHAIEGIGKRYSGDYYINLVRHQWDADNGYVCDFNARKVLD